MEITRLGKHCFRIKGKRAMILTDPPQDLKNLTAHILLFSSSATENKVKGEPVVIFGPGEYEIREVIILGIREKQGMFFKIKTDNLSLLYISDLKEKIAEEKIEVLNQVDILFLPIGKPKIASSLVSQLEPLIVIPMEKEGLDEFLKEQEVEKTEKLDKLVVTKDELMGERKIIVLK